VCAVAFLSNSTAYIVGVVGPNIVTGVTAVPLAVKALLKNTLDIVGFTTVATFTLVMGVGRVVEADFDCAMG
jgi:hypothetical protein